SEQPALVRLTRLENQAPDLLTECLCSAMLSLKLAHGDPSSQFITDAPIISVAAAKQSKTLVEKMTTRLHSALNSNAKPEKPTTELDPIMQRYARKILGEDAEMPNSYTELIIEGRRRGREGLPQPHLRPHRCDKHLQDFFDGIFLGEAWEPAKVYWRCLKSKMNEEPERYKLKGDPKTIGR
ncbi:hypothetical protein EV181_007265, partial [Coemansia sp. RSA 532]